MEEWLRFSVCYWHTFRGTGETIGINLYIRDERALVLVRSSPAIFVLRVQQQAHSMGAATSELAR